MKKNYFSNKFQNSNFQNNGEKYHINIYNSEYDDGQYDIFRGKGTENIISGNFRIYLEKSEKIILYILNIWKRAQKTIIK